MHRTASKIRPGQLAMCTAMAAVIVTAGVGQSDWAQVIATPAFAATSEARVEKQVKQAERAVAKMPDNAQARADLAQTYLSVGRFASAATTFEDAVALGDASPRTALGMALAYIGAGRGNEAVTVLNQWRESLPASDLGLALALAGQTGQGVTILTDALRNGDNTPKLRQNLAYAYALDGRWSEARLMAAQDVPANLLDARISEWARQGKPEDYNVRVAGLLGAPLRADPGQPAALALRAATTEKPALAALTAPQAGGDEVPAEASAPPPAPAPAQELPPVKSGESFWGGSPAQVAQAAVPAPTPAAPPAAQPQEPQPTVAQAFAADPAPTPYVYKPVEQAVPASPRKPAPASPARAYARVAANPTHLVQLGAFSSPENARRAVKIFQARNPALKQHDMRITKAVVRGKTYWRVAAAGFDGTSARSMCSYVKSQGRGCFAYAATAPWPAVASAAPYRARR
ncbi:SPOR domain-containing protein [Novosphingobium sp. H3SJ31-1]|uniref:SPOR domain-containing protein n=2 Tax=Novosphingobium album (ex Liu et al. 2023) TaxID=3031130 RepID=A0ABT5WRJ6_9SPHN|nr:SPOR domain-containing protein [Novosphingobium album (ex Liu et al. 2023)]